jgi:hypothetical protein
MSETDHLSPLAHRLLKINATDAYARLVVHGHGDDDARAALEMLTPDQLLSVPVTRAPDARAMLAGLWLWHDWLDQSHTISQSLHDANGSFWHAIMHRREGDFSNSKYWYDKVGRHTMLSVIGVAVASAIDSLPADKSLVRLLAGGWSPHAFVDLVEDVSRQADDPRLPVVMAVQRIEWRILFDHCTRQAGGKR